MDAQQLLNGLFIGSMYAVFALGYTLVFGVLDILNLAHAAVFMVAAFLGVTLAELGLQLCGPVPSASAIHLVNALVPPAAATLAGVLGLVLERVAFRPLRERADSNIAGLISSLAMATVLGAMALELWGPNVVRFPLETLQGAHARALGVVSWMQLKVMLAAAALVLGLTWLVRRTRLGRELRAVAENPRAAQVLGIDVDRVVAASFFLSSFLGGAAGVLYGQAYDVSVDMVRSVELKGLAVIIVGGMGSMPGAVLAGLALGVTEVLVVAHLGASWRDVVCFAGLFLILVVRPRGLLGAAATREA